MNKEVPDMTEAEINRSIAIYTGWKFEPCQEWKDRFGTWGSKSKWCIAPDGTDQFVHSIPNYCNDFNAMRTILLTLSEEQVIDFMEWLGVDFPEHPSKIVRMMISSARQQATAFIRMITI